MVLMLLSNKLTNLKIKEMQWSPILVSRWCRLWVACLKTKTILQC